MKHLNNLTTETYEMPVYMDDPSGNLYTLSELERAYDDFADEIEDASFEDYMERMLRTGVLLRHTAYIDIVETSGEYMAYIQIDTCGIKSLMFGAPKEQQSKDYFIQLVEANLSDYADSYYDEFCLD